MKNRFKEKYYTLQRGNYTIYNYKSLTILKSGYTKNVNFSLLYKNFWSEEHYHRLKTRFFLLFLYIRDGI